MYIITKTICPGWEKGKVFSIANFCDSFGNMIVAMMLFTLLVDGGYIKPYKPKKK